MEIIMYFCEMEDKSQNNIRKPDWLKIKLPKGNNFTKVKGLVNSHGLNTICVSGKCPNMGECWNAGTATFMILGDICTRSCKFCATKSGRPTAVDSEEPQKIAESVKELKLKHIVLTSVDRDDLEDYGANHWAKTISTIKNINPNVTIEALIPDMMGKTNFLDIVINSKPEIISHNMETVERLTPSVRSAANYKMSLEVLKYISEKGTTTKSGIMAGLGETYDEVIETMKDLKNAGCSIFTIGQYLQPTPMHLPVSEYITPEQFDKYKEEGLKIGFKFVESKPLVRSSYHAEKHIVK